MIKKVVKLITVAAMLMGGTLVYGEELPRAVVREINSVEEGLGASVGVAVYDPERDIVWEYNGDKRFPLMSTFKTLAAGNILYRSDLGEVSLDESVVIEEEDILSYAPVTRKHVGSSMTLEEVASAAMLMSDNTAANILLDRLGGPQELTEFLRGAGDQVTRIDRMEPELNEALEGDERDTTTPVAIVNTLDRLLYGDILSQESRDQLKEWMVGNRVADNLLRSVLPEGYLIADRSGAGGYGSRGITAVVWRERWEPLIISIYLAQTEASFDERNEVIVQIGEAIFSQYLD